jgi:hypothetical protein
MAEPQVFVIGMASTAGLGGYFRMADHWSTTFLEPRRKVFGWIDLP